MSNYYLRRILASLFTIFLIVTITFFAMRAIPGGPFTREKAIPDEVLAAINEKYNLDDPLFKQYLDYLKGVVTWDLGPSFQFTGRYVDDIIAQKAPTSAVVGGLA